MDLAQCLLLEKLQKNLHHRPFHFLKVKLSYGCSLPSRLLLLLSSAHFSFSLQQRKKLNARETGTVTPGLRAKKSNVWRKRYSLRRGKSARLTGIAMKVLRAMMV